MKELFKKFELKNKVSLVVGGSGQIGSETVKVLLAAGSTVINIDNFNKIKAQKKYFYHKVNIVNEREIIKFKELFKKKYKKLNILINHAHYIGTEKKNFFSKLEKYPTVEWKNTLATNLDGMFFVTKHFIQLLIKNKKSVILNTSSIYGKVSPNKNIYGKSGINSPIGYATSKSAIIGFTKYIATHYGDKGLRANVLIPGGVENKKQSKDFKKKYKNFTPVKRFAKEDEYKEAVLFLISDASSYMTGAEFIIDGGWTAW